MADQSPRLEVDRVTHHSILLRWSSPEQAAEVGRLLYTVQQEEEGTGEAREVRGHETHHEFTGLSVLTQYTYRVSASSDTWQGPWSEPLTVSTNKQPKTAENLHRAIARGDSETLVSILEESPNYIDTPDLYSSSPLMCAARLGQTRVVEVLLDLGASVDYHNSSGKTSLMEACYFGHLECVQLLVDGGAAWMMRDNAGCSALHWAVDGGHTDVVEFSLQQGMPVDDTVETTLLGWTPLMRTAAVDGSATVARVLIEAGADIDRRDKDGKTVLMLAALNGYDEVVKVLLRSGVDIMAANEYGKTALDFAVSLGNKGTAQLLQAAKENMDLA